MKSRRVIFSLREDEISLLLVILKNYMSTVHVDSESLPPVQLQAQKILGDNVMKLINKLEKNNER